MDTREKSAIALCAEGKLEAFGVLYELYVERIYAFLFWRIRNKETAEDLTSQTFIKAMDKIRSFDASRGKFSSWLYRIAQNTLIDHVRSRRIHDPLEAMFNAGTEAVFAEKLDSKRDIERIKEGLLKLTPGQRSIVIMRVWDGLSYAEIAGVVGKSEAACKMDFSRAIAKLRAEAPFAFAALMISILNL